MRELLTPALAGQNPKAYAAHFRRLETFAQRDYLSALAVDDLKTHFQTMGESATVGLFLTVGDESFRLEATVGGVGLGEALGPENCRALQTRALRMGAAIEARGVSGLVVGSLMRLEQTERALAALGWALKTLILAGDPGGVDCAPSLGWAMRGAIGGEGTFYMPNEPLRWEERVEIEERLRRLSARTASVLDVRVG